MTDDRPTKQNYGTAEQLRGTQKTNNKIIMKRRDGITEQIGFFLESWNTRATDRSIDRPRERERIGRATVLLRRHRRGAAIALIFRPSARLLVCLSVSTARLPIYLSVYQLYFYLPICVTVGR